ncbi:MAG: O-antigen ligase family protein, partial [Bacteroidia bacterium]|nr:O-antigen ligase family protein [Bacteroidia bacterium]
TFSRGGVVAAIIVIIAFLWTIYYRSSRNQKNQIVGSVILLVIAAAFTWVLSSNQTSGLIDNRYTNKDSRGREKGDFSTGRLELFKQEIEGFLSSPFLGVGASRTKNKRFDEKGAVIASHNEIGRLLSEHGMLGFLIIAILIIKPLTYRSNNKSNFMFYAFLAFWFATINHSGMRIAAPSFLYAMSLINVVNEKHPLHRKQLKN